MEYRKKQKDLEQREIKVQDQINKRRNEKKELDLKRKDDFENRLKHNM